MLHRYPCILLMVLCLSIFRCAPISAADAPNQPPVQPVQPVAQANQNSPEETMTMLTSIGELQKNLRQQVKFTREKIKSSTSDAEIERLEQELAHMDQQLSDSTHDFERIATGVEIGLFVAKKPEAFSWKQEIATLVEPAIKEIKRLTERARQKTNLKDTIDEYSKLLPIAANAIKQLEILAVDATTPEIEKQLKALLPEWHNTEKRIRNKLELAQLELSQMQDQDVSLVESSSKSIRHFFRDRGFFLTIAIITFGLIVLAGRLTYRVVFRFLPGSNLEKRPFHIRLVDLLLRGLTVVAAIFGLFLVLYQAEDWVLLSMAIIFFLGLAWTVRQTVPKLWQQGRLMLNIGSVREGERLLLHGVPWKVETIHVFCRLSNPNLGIELRVPIEHLVGMVSRPYLPEEPWFPCKKGDWVVISDQPRAKVVSLSHELVELVERGGKRHFYQTSDFLGQNPINLSRNFRLRVAFGISYDLQAQATTTIPARLQSFIENKLEEEGYNESCLNLLVEFAEAGESSLNLLIIADFKGDQADIYKRLERAIQRYCVDAATLYNWEIPFPQLTFHWPARDRLAVGEQKANMQSAVPS